MTVQCGSDEPSHRPRLGPLPTPPLGRVRAPSMEPAALPIKSMALPLSWRVVPWPRPPGGSALPSSSSTPVGGEAPGDLLDTPFPLPRLYAHHVPSLSLPPERRIRYCPRNRVVKRAGAPRRPAVVDGLGPLRSTAHDWSVPHPFAVALTILPAAPAAYPGPKDPAGMIRERQRTTLASAGCRLHARRSHSIHLRSWRSMRCRRSGATVSLDLRRQRPSTSRSGKAHCGPPGVWDRAHTYVSRRHGLVLRWRRETSVAWVGALSVAGFAFDGWCRVGVFLAGVDLDTFGLYLRRLGHHDLQHAVLGRGLDRVRHDMGGQR